MIIAHRLSTISLADEVVVLDHGRIVARGPHDQLVQTSPVYREIHDHGLVERRFVDLDPDGRRSRRTAASRRAARPEAGCREHLRKPRRPPGRRPHGSRARGSLRRVKELWAYNWPYRRRSAAALAMMLLATATSIAGPLAIKQAIDRGIAASPGLRPGGAVGRRLRRRDAGQLGHELGADLPHRLGRDRILADLRIGLFAHIQRLDLGFFERNRAGVVISRLTNDIEALVNAVVDGPTTLVQNTIVLIGSAGVLVCIDWKLALATLTVFPGMAIGTAVFRYYSSRAYRGRAAGSPRSRASSRRTSPASGSSRPSGARARTTSASWRSTTTTGRPT